MPVMLYFASIVLTGALSVCLAAYAWRRPSVQGARIYAGLALGEGLLALAEILSMLSPTPAQALFWYQVRYLALAAIPVFWLVFALEYSGRQDWLSRRLLAGMCVIPVSTQIILWSNPLHGLWVRQEVGLHQTGPFWIAETFARLPGLGFMAHSVYAELLLLAGIVLLLVDAWRMRQRHRGRALFIAGAATTTFVFATASTVNLLPRTGFNLFTPGIGVSVLLGALAVFRFPFLKHAPAADAHFQAQAQRARAVFLLIFAIMLVSVSAAGFVSYQAYEQQFRQQVESQLSSIAALKMAQLQDWRQERLADAELIRHNPVFSALVQRYLENPANAQTQTELQAWLESYQVYGQYDRVFLLDTRSVVRLFAPSAPESVTAHLAQDVPAVLSAGQVTLLDFHRDTPDDAIHLAILAPIFAEQAASRPLGILVLSIDPRTYLYPLIQQWPTPSQTAELLLIRRDGNDALYLNDFRYRSNAALILRIPLERTDIPAVRAALGQTGIMQGVDYRGVPVLADVRAVPNSPWFLIAKIDAVEVYAPLRERLWQTAALIGALLVAAGAGLGGVWRQQRMRYYRGQVVAAQALQASEARYRKLLELAPVGITVYSEGKIVFANPAGARLFGADSEKQIIGKPLTELTHPDGLKLAQSRMQRMLTGEQGLYPAEEVYLKLDGTPINVQILAMPLSYQEKPAIQVIVTDITERKRMEEETALKNRHLTLLNHLGRALNKLASLPEILEQINNLIGQIFDNRNLYIALYDEATNFVSFPIYWMAGERRNSLEGRPLSNGLTESVIRARAPILIPDHVQEALAERGITLIGTICQCYLGVPILIDEHVIGVIAVQDYEHAHVFHANHVELLTTIASQAAIAIENARLYEAIQQELTERERAEEALQQQNQFLIALQNTTLELVSQLDLKTLLENIVKRACALVGTSAGLLELVDPATNQLIPQIGVGALAEALHLPVQPGEGLTGIIWQTGEMLVVPDYDQWAGRLAGFSHSTLGSVIGVPLLSGAHVLGVLATGSAHGSPHHFDPAAIEVLKQFARLATVAVQNARLFADLQAELSERKRTEEALQESTARLHAVVRTANDAIITMDRQGSIVDWNAAAETIFGYSSDEAIGMPIGRITPEQFRVQQRRGVERAIASNNRRIVGETIEVSGLAKDGREFPVEMSLAEWQTQDGNFFTAIIRDINERKQAEERIVQSEKKYRELFDVNKDGIAVFLVNPHGPPSPFVELNDAAYQMLGYTREEMLKLTPVMLEPNLTPEQLQFRQSQFDSKGAANFETLLQHKDGHPVFTEFTAQMIQYENQPAIMNIVRDITERKRQEMQILAAQAELQRLFTEADLSRRALLSILEDRQQAEDAIRQLNAELEQRVAERTAELHTQFASVEAILNSASDGVLVTTADGEITRRNPVARRWLDEALSAPDAQRLRQAVRDLATQAAQQPTLTLELAGLDLQLAIAPITGADAHEPSGVVTLHDVSQLKTLDRMRAAFVSNVSHELRTPAATIKLAIGLLRRRPKENWDKYLAMLETEADRLAHLVEDILQVSRIESGRAELRLETLDLNALMHSAAEGRQVVADERGLALTHETAAPAPKVCADLQRLSEIANNLIENAIWYTPRGGQIVTSAGIECLEDREWAFFRVSDTGMGIAQEELALIFERFYRGAQPRAQQIAGTGLGLAIVKDLVTLHGGRITVQSQVGVGTTFTVWLPLA